MEACLDCVFESTFPAPQLQVTLQSLPPWTNPIDTGLGYNILDLTSQVKATKVRIKQAKMLRHSCHEESTCWLSCTCAQVVTTQTSESTGSHPDTITWQLSNFSKKLLEGIIQLSKKWLGKPSVKEMAKTGIYFTVGQTKALIMNKEQNVCVISLNNAEIIQSFEERQRKWKTV